MHTFGQICLCDLIILPGGLDHQLLKHVMSGVQVFEDHGRRSYFFATDKANVSVLEQIFWTLQTNAALLGCPNVFWLA